MSEGEHNPLITRLAERAEAPGVVNGKSLQQRVDRLQRTAVAHDVADRLQERARPAEQVRSGSLVWRQGSRDAEVETMSPTGASPLTMPIATPVSASSPATAQGVVIPRSISSAAQTRSVTASSAPVSIQRSALPVSEASPTLEQRLNARLTPGVVPVAPYTQIAGLNAAAPFAAALQTRYGVAKSHDSIVMHAPAMHIARSAQPGVIQRKTESHLVNEVSNSSAPHTPATERAPVTRSTASATELPPVSVPQSIAISHTPSMTLARKLASTPGSSESAKTDANSSTERPTSSVTIPPVRSVASVRERNPEIAAGPNLILQRAMADPTPRANSIPSTSPISPAKDQVTPSETPAPKAAIPHASLPGSGVDVDLLAEEVGRRLAQRLEVERERRGMRRWR